MSMKTVAAAAAALALLVSAAHATQPSALRGLANSMTDETRRAMADYHLNDVLPASGKIAIGTVTDIVIRDGVALIPRARAYLDLRMFNIYLVNRSYRPPPAASTRQTIDAWTNTVLFSSPPGYGSSIDQWVAMAWFLGPPRH